MAKEHIVSIDSNVVVNFDRKEKPVVLKAGRIELFFDSKDAVTCAESLIEAAKLYRAQAVDVVSIEPQQRTSASLKDPTFTVVKDTGTTS